MRTVPTLAASGAGISLATIGLAVIREEPPSQQRRDPSPFTSEMTTAVATYPQPNFSSKFDLYTPRSASEGQNGKARSGDARVGQKRTLTPKASFSLGVERPFGREEDESASRTQTPSQAGTPNAQAQSWLRRLSSNMSTSRDSNQTPPSRPGSAAVSYSNGSLAFSHAGSTTPIFPDQTPTSLPPNKLVKRTPSVRSMSGSPFQSPGSRLPLPVFRRPATSHQRSATLQERLSGADQDDRMSIDGRSSDTRDPPQRQYFTTKVAADELSTSRRRTSTGIPNPIKRIYPDRKYTPLLVRASDRIRPAQTEVDDGLSDEEDNMAVTRLQFGTAVTSSPILSQPNHFEEAEQPRRSFSIGDLLSTGPQPLWRRPSQNRSKANGSRLLRKSKARVFSAPQAVMSNSLSAGTDSERPAKRRDLTDPFSARRTIYSSSSNDQHASAEADRTIELNLGTELSQAPYIDAVTSPFGESPSQALIPSALEQHRLPSADAQSMEARSARVSAAQSEITSTVDSDSEYRSIGDASTDYQSDTPYDSFPTRTTWGSVGRRGPHIETIFDDSPPNFSSGRSTRLKDILNEGPEYGTRYRHSTIEEEESIVSTPVRSTHDKSVQSTPSARAGAQQLFTSSPPAMPILPDPDEIDWDAPDENPPSNGFHNADTMMASSETAFDRNLPLRFGPALQHTEPMSADAMSHRPNGTSNDKTTLFDWSEVQPSPGHNNSPPRPRTVHGKKDPESRGSRPPGRRAPSGMHARSHSVPVVPDMDGKRNNVVANKFGTWGVGSKAVTEDWNEDFDFEDVPAPIPENIKQHETRVDSGHEMFVPRSIREQQDSVMANIGLLREWGLLIEELKDLRVRAVALGMVNGRSAQAWQEVDAMIELADQETEEHTLEPRRSPPSSPAFDYTAFDEPIPSLANLAYTADEPMEPSEPDFPPAPSRTFPRPSPPPSTPQQVFTGRARKDSEAVARSVIEALQSRRSISDPTALKAVPPSRKVPFDTATLRHIVPYVKDLKRKIKDALRETEGLYSSPRRPTKQVQSTEDQDNEPSFRSIFNDPQDDDVSIRRRSRRQQAVTDHDGFDDISMDDSGDLAQRMQNMNIPQ